MSRYEQTHVAPAKADLAALAPLVARLARAYGKGLDPDEAVSQTWWRVLRAAETYEPGRGRAFESWAIWHVRSGLWILRRSAARRRGRLAFNTEWVEEKGAAPAVESTDVFQSEALDAAVEALPPRQRQAVELVYFRELSREAAGVEMGGITHQAVSNLLAKAMLRLREALA